MPVESVFGAHYYQLAPAAEAQNEQRSHERFPKHSQTKKEDKNVTRSSNALGGNADTAEQAAPDPKPLGQIVDSVTVLELVSHQHNPSTKGRNPLIEKTARHLAIGHYRQISRIHHDKNTAE